jgi:hypothetical protein
MVPPARLIVDVLRVTLPPPSLLVEFLVAVAVIFASSERVSLGVLMVISPGLPSPLLSTEIMGLPLSVRVRFMAVRASTIMLPPCPSIPVVVSALNIVSALICDFPVTLTMGASMRISPALPVPEVLLVIWLSMKLILLWLLITTVPAGFATRVSL